MRQHVARSVSPADQCSRTRLERAAEIEACRDRARRAERAVHGGRRLRLLGEVGAPADHGARAAPDGAAVRQPRRDRRGSAERAVHRRRRRRLAIGIGPPTDHAAVAFPDGTGVGPARRDRDRPLAFAAVERVRWRGLPLGVEAPADDLALCGSYRAAVRRRPPRSQLTCAGAFGLGSIRPRLPVRVVAPAPRLPSLPRLDRTAVGVARRDRGGRSRRCRSPTGGGCRLARASSEPQQTTTPVPSWIAQLWDVPAAVRVARPSAPFTLGGIGLKPGIPRPDRAPPQGRARRARRWPPPREMPRGSCSSSEVLPTRTKATSL